jgi:hypothetical protein
MALFFRRTFWRETPRLAKAAFILAGIGVTYLVLLALLMVVTGIMSGGDASHPPGVSVTAAVVMSVVSGVMYLAVGGGFLALIAFGLRSSTLAFKWVGVGLAALAGLAGLGSVLVALVSADFTTLTTGSMAEFALLGLPVVVVGLAYIPIAVLGAREALRMGHGGKHQALSA